MNDIVELEGVERLKKDLREAMIRGLQPSEVRYLVDIYYQTQKFRTRAANQKRDASKAGEPCELAAWTFTQYESIEGSIKTALEEWAKQNPVGRWSLSVYGIGPIISAGLLAHIDITQAPTVGHIWAFSGLDPTKKWNKAEKRPWNAKLKVICFHIGESFCKFSGRDECYYGKLYLERKAYEIEKNVKGDYADQCEVALKKTWKDGSNGVKWYGGCFPAEAYKHIATLGTEAARNNYLKSVEVPAGEGVPMLPPAHIDRRAKRWTTKLFLAHFHGVAFKEHYGTEPPLPYPIAYIPWHTHVIEPPAKATEGTNVEERQP